MTERQKIAKTRNWSKKLIKGFYINLNIMDGLSLKEKSSIDIIKFHIDKILIQWDAQSTELGLKPSNPKCAKHTCQTNENVKLYKSKELDIKVFLCKNCVDLKEYNLVSDEYKKNKLLART